ncbi:MAG: DUF3160 domain-containing protein, partial [Candidatus Absconditabacteria bacterium]
MKRFLPLLVITLVLAGCGTTSTIPSTTISRDGQTSTGPLLVNKESKYTFNFDMAKPKITEMKNWTSLLEGFTALWKNIHTPSENDMVFYKSPEGKTECSGGIELLDQHGKLLQTIPFDTYMKPNAKFVYTGHYEGTGIGLELSEAQKTKFSDQGRLVTKANSGFLANLQKTNPYQDTESGLSPTEERVNGLSQIGGSSIEYQRYPYNTLLVTSDLVLHLYHKIFDNALKAYEETKARPTMQVFASNMLNKFEQLAKKEKNPDLKRQY